MGRVWAEERWTYLDLSLCGGEGKPTHIEKKKKKKKQKRKKK